MCGIRTGSVSMAYKCTSHYAMGHLCGNVVIGLLVPLSDISKNVELT